LQSKHGSSFEVVLVLFLHLGLNEGQIGTVLCLEVADLTGYLAAPVWLGVLGSSASKDIGIFEFFFLAISLLDVVDESPALGSDILMDDAALKLPLPHHASIPGVALVQLVLHQ
jgi:hypothetical protein